ncbi:MAG: hypothetical protein COV29_04205 [Candidatus Yanofskybacteria bacterium CG10_big_fil_rev_8_21_14_0_10_36_16]|uniref:Uncharacterized protein n=1 Tax=Candidatus Yanofskybacteria bacterium CG10_big_fil_rev_8_21_14_0_10_36_16 TaxID=1975096 RepID=A0A2J0Q6C8_9BACT|nr:MAG: hypothetical protein COV29_04205 [Candidatus Yanofskybacteria bacterium CG10_big_fil_rev_8_21_14_0_10_36_16]
MANLNNKVALLFLLITVVVLNAGSVFALEFENPLCVLGGGCNNVPDTFIELVEQIADQLILIAIPIVVIMIIVAGVIMYTSRGNSQKFQQGTRTLWYAIIGLAVVLIGRGFVALIESVLALRGNG